MSAENKTTKTYQYLDFSYLDLVSEGDADMRETMLEMLLDELPTEMEKMKNLIDANDYENLREVSHKMKSTLPFVGNEAMTDANAFIELSAKDQQNLDQIPAKFATMLALAPMVIAELKMELGQ